MKKLILLWLAAAVVASGQQVTPNIGLLIQTPPQYANNWGAITNYNFQKIDTAFAGVGSQFKGTWVNSTSYAAGNVVQYIGQLYMSIQSSNLNQNPVSQTAYWTQISNTGSFAYPSAGLAASTGSAWRAPVFGDVVNLWAGGSCTSGYLKFDGTCSTPSGTGVSSLQSLTGGITLESTDSSVTITTPDGSHINLAATGGGGGSIVPPNPSTTQYAVLTDSRGLSSTSSQAAITVTGVSYTGGVATLTATNTLHAGDWIGLNAGISPACMNTNPYFYQVLSAGLSGSQFEVNAPACSGTGTGTGGTIEDATYIWPLTMANLPYFAGHGTVLDYNPASGETIANLQTFYDANVASISNLKYVFILVGYDDLVINGECAVSVLPAMETAYQSLWADIHSHNQLVVMLTNPANSHVGDAGACNTNSYYYAFTQLNAWTKAQGKTSANLSTGYWDYLVDAATQINQWGGTFPGNLYTQQTNQPNFTDAGNQIIAQLANATLTSSTLQLHSQAGNGDSAPNLQQNANWYIPDNGSGGSQQELYQTTATTPVFWSVEDQTDNNCIAIGQNSNFSIGDPAIFVSFSDSSCQPALLYPFLSFHDTSPGNYGHAVMPKNEGFGWNGNFAQGAADATIGRAGTGIINVGSGGNPTSDTTGAMQMAGIGLGTAHIPGHAFDCSGVGCPSGGSTGIPFIPIQEGGGTNGINGTNYTYTFPQAAAASGNTLFILASADGAQSVICPTGWTSDFNITSATYSRLMLCQKTSASDTSAAFLFVASTISVYFWELSGSRTFDQLATATVTETPVFRTPNLTPTAGSLVFSAAGIVNNNSVISSYYSPLVYSQFLTDPTWKSIFVGSNEAGSRSLSAFVSQISATGALLTPPLNSNGVVVPFSGGGLTEATFSIK